MVVVVEKGRDMKGLEQVERMKNYLHERIKDEFGLP
jgi:hypothetical protein